MTEMSIHTLINQIEERSFEDQAKIIMTLLKNSHKTEILEAIKEAITLAHRTNTQSFFRNLGRIIREYAKTPENFYDGRNEASVRWAKKVSEISLHLPFI